MASDPIMVTWRATVLDIKCNPAQPNCSPFFKTNPCIQIETMRHIIFVLAYHKSNIENIYSVFLLKMGDQNIKKTKY